MDVVVVVVVSLDGIQIPCGKWQFWGGRAPHCKIWGHSAVSCENK